MLCANSGGSRTFQREDKFLLNEGLLAFSVLSFLSRTSSASARDFSAGDAGGVGTNDTLLSLPAPPDMRAGL